MQYDRKIKYFDYYEKGERIKGAGFIKLEVRENILRLELNIRGLHSTDSFVRDVILVGPETEEVLGQITIEEGIGCFKHTCRMDHNIGSTNIPYEELQEIRIPVGGSRELCCAWKKREKKPEKVPTEDVSQSKIADWVEEYVIPEVHEPLISMSIEQPADNPEPTAQVMENREKNQEDVDNSLMKTPYPVKEEYEKQESLGQQQSLGQQKSLGQQESAELQESTGVHKGVKVQESAELQAMWSQTKPDTDRENRNSVVRLLEDKWQQIFAIYPHIRPFEDEREYISLSPSDFVMLPAKYYRAANNSFLLHGYYNYKHLILVRVERRGEALYYLGVPGNYFDREKQVAVMFGFESFECAQEPARTGDFGYYMMRIEL